MTMQERRFTAMALLGAGFAAMILAAPTRAQQGAPPPAVLVQAAELKPIADQSEFIGRAAAVDKVELRARVKGFLGPRKFSDGDLVKEGQVLFTIEPEPYQAAVDQKVAQRDAAKAALTNAEVQLTRAEELLRTRTGTQVTYDQRLSEQLQAKAQLEDASAQLRDAQIQLSYTEIKSPIAGRIGRASVSPGNIVGPDSGVLATVVSENPIRVLFSITQRELLEARRDSSASGDGLVVRLRLADGSIYKDKGKLDFIDVTADAKTDGQMVRAVFDNKLGLLTDGQTVRVIVEGEKVPTVVAVPQAAIAQDQSGPYLFIVNDKNVAEQKRVKVGVARDGLVGITEGLKAGERVIVQGQQRVRPGMTVNPTMAPPSASTQKQ
ncbi:MAG: efflux RND transporter periplasmic adaptor subunit [Reyranella sp.]|uniref:efflux RND transporter periplasmic adaptor subunit n=1 Tax=Reyranella sp. TaxID=1929291 RepID=UPI002731EFC9|nr:efflux RND transporter periplasmic adaptor subunit [Reyranella sp.]MDP1965319.1 efflux RND transporter periplasmic adaptor subunit [Reyranella sp.]MDP2377997.1 efflux RND transporter periplasmic adaptor subunit [Reyranella sp.]